MHHSQKTNQSKNLQLFFEYNLANCFADLLSSHFAILGELFCTSTLCAAFSLEILHFNSPNKQRAF